MRNRKTSQEKAAAAHEAAMKERGVMFDTFRSHLAMTIISDSVEHHSKCRFGDCREAGRCLSLDRFEGVCPVPLDNNLAMMFGAMIWFDEAMFAAEERERHTALEETVAGLEAEIASMKRQ